MKLSELQNLSLENLGSWPLPVKVGTTAIACAVLLGVLIKFYTMPQLEELAKEQQKEVSLKQEFDRKQRKAANLEALKEQLREIEDSFGEMLRRLPDDTEVAGLLVDISQQGLGAGLEFELFKPGSERPADFYAELPIRIRVVGSYHEFGTFISGISALPRIVTSHDVRITPRAKGNDQELVMEMTAKTYRYLDDTQEVEGTIQ